MSEAKNDNQKKNIASVQNAEPVAFVLREGQISISDSLTFYCKADVLNALGTRKDNGEPYKSLQTALVRTSDKRYVWFPIIDKKGKDSGKKKDSNDKWYNIMVDDEHITEMCEDPKLDKNWKERAKAFDDKQPVRYLVFSRINKKGYEYLGTFEMAGYDYTQRPYKTFWRRVETSAQVCKIFKDKR